MAKNHTFIELNGKRYNTSTGEAVSGAPVPASRSAAAHKFAKSIDGLSISSAPILTPAKSFEAKPTPILRGPAPIKAMDIRSPRKPAGRHLQPHPAEHSKTLRRQAVTKPNAALKKKISTGLPAHTLAKKPANTAAPKMSFHSVDPARQQRAQKITHNNLISRFGGASRGAVQSRPVTTAQPPKIQAAHTQPPITKAPAADIFEQALARATSHQQSAVKTKKLLRKSAKHKAGRRNRRIAGVSSAILAILLIGGFVLYQNKANLSMRVASAKAGFHATLPGWQPNGFAAEKIQYSPGVVAVDFQNDNNQQDYTLTQKISNWDSSTLLNNFVEPKSSTYKTREVAGRTVYIYGDNNAAWVNGGVQYNLEGNYSLNKNQLIRVVSST